MKLHFVKNLVFQKNHLLLKLIFRATDLEQCPKFSIFRKALFWTWASSTNLVLKTVPITPVQYLWTGFTFFDKKLIIFGVSMHFYWNKTSNLKTEIFRQSCTKRLWTYSCFKPFHFTISEAEQDLQKVNIRVALRVAERLKTS